MKVATLFVVSIVSVALLFSCKKSTKPVIPGWEVLSIGTNVDLFAVDFVDENYGWVVGRDSAVYHTTDGGNTWTRQRIPPIHEIEYPPLSDIHFVDRQHGWVVGTYGMIYKTTDGGENWLIAESLQTGAINKVFFSDLRHGWISGSASVGSLRTTDGGQTWEKIPFWDDFIDSLNGWGGGGAVVYKTSDGGVSWVEIYNDGGAFGASLDFVDLYHGWGLVGGRVSEYDFWYWIIHTSDGGYSWELQLDTFKYSLLGVFGEIGPMEMLNSTTGWIGKFETDFESGKVTVLHTTDGGRTWLEQPLPRASVLDIDFINEKEGWAVGYKGSIIRTRNGGNPIR